MKRRRRVLAETLIILASALVVLVLISSSPAEAAGAPPVDPPVEADPPNPINNPGTNPSLPPEESSENAEDDPIASQPTEQAEKPNNEAIEDVPQSESDESTSQLPPSNQQQESIDDVGSNDEDQIPSDNSLIDATANSEAITDNALLGLEVNEEVLMADHDLADGAHSEDDDCDHELTWDDDEFFDDAESILEDELQSEMPDDADEELLTESQVSDGTHPVVKEPEARDEPKRESSSSERKEKERGLTTSSGIEVVEIRVSSHIDKIIEEPITKFLFGMYTRLDTAEDLRGVRKKIYQYIKAHPGEHMATLMKEFKLSPSSISHHINVLEKNGFIISHSDGRYKRLFVNGNGYISTLSDNYKCQISALKNENAKRIVFFLMARPSSTQYELSNALDLHPSTIHWHAKKLTSLGLISAIRDGKNIRYAVDDSTCVLRVLSVVETVNVGTLP